MLMGACDFKSIETIIIFLSCYDELELNYFEFVTFFLSIIHVVNIRSLFAYFYSLAEMPH